MPERRYPIVEVEWTDSYTSHGWDSQKQHVNDPAGDIRTVGYLIERTKEWTRVATGHDGQEPPSMADFHSIPAHAITSFKVLRK